MAKTDLETLVVRLEAQVKSFENELKRGRTVADRETRAIEKRFADSNKRLSASFAGVGAGLKGALATLGLGLGAREVQRFADSFTNIQNALKVAGLEGTDLTRVYDQLFASAQRNAAPLEALAQLYGRVALVQKELNVSSDELVGFTDKIALALRVSGKSAQESSGALLQLSQALGGGVVRAEEFNSILEGAPTIAQAAAAGITEAGGSVAKLRTLVIDGKVSSEAFFRGFQAGSVILEKRAATMQTTVGQAITQLTNAFVDAVGRIDGVTGASSSAVKAMKALADQIEAIAGNVATIKGPYDEISKALHGASVEAQGLVGWLQTISRFSITGNLSRYIVEGVRNVDRTSPALRAPSGGADEAGFAGFLEQGRAAANVQLPRARPDSAANPISLGDFPAAGKGTADALKKATDEARKFNEEIARAPLAEFARDAADVNTNLQDAAVSGLLSFENALVGIVTGSASAKEAFHDMANAILADIARLLIRQFITGPIAGAIGGALNPLGTRAAGGPVSGGSPYLVGERGPELFVPGQNGAIVPNHALRKSGGGNVVVSITSAPTFQAGMTPTDIAAIDARLSQHERRLRTSIPDDIRRGLRNDRGFLG